MPLRLVFTARADIITRLSALLGWRTPNGAPPCAPANDIGFIEETISSV